MMTTCHFKHKKIGYWVNAPPGGYFLIAIEGDEYFRKAQHKTLTIAHNEAKRIINEQYIGI